MHLIRRTLLAIVLTLFLLGLVAHLLPVALCGCATLAGESDAGSNPDLCLVCQLQAGIHISVQYTGLNHETALKIYDRSVLKPLNHVSRVLHPPIA